MKPINTYMYDNAFAERIALELNSAHSDKASLHSYHNVYAHLFEGLNVTSFLEIGLFLNDLQYTDLTAWANIFPNAKLYGIDIKQDQFFTTEQIKMAYGDQFNLSSIEEALYFFDDQFNIVIDDASHIMDATINTFETIFPYVVSGGLYIIEDILDNGFNGNDWQQKIDLLQQYFESTNLRYEIFQSQPAQKVVDFDAHEITDLDFASDDYLICVYK